ncbi:MAG: 16S rRNA (guanine(527)-N(7))-methyltransferase RsmG [Leptospirillia bacterium]
MPDIGQHPLIEALTRGCHALGVHPDAVQLEGLATYAVEAMRWGRRINLTGADSAEGFASTHIIDSVSLLPNLPIKPGTAWADVGSGAGLPGIPLALLAPESRWSLVEPREKRWAFLLHISHRLGLANVTPVRGRAPEAQIPAGSLDGVVSRALGRPALSAHVWLKPGGMLVLEASNPDGWDDVPDRYPLTPLPPLPLRLPGVPDCRHLVRFLKVPA